MKYAHVGMGKAGSTTLQREVFTQFRGEFISSDTRLPHGYQEIYLLNNRYDNRFSKLTRKRHVGELKIRLQGALSGRKFRVPDDFLLSSEGLLGCSFSPRVNSIKNAMFLKNRYGIHKVLIVYRRPDEYIASLFNQLKMDKRIDESLTFEFFFGETEKALLNTKDILIAPAVADYVKVFGAENIGVLDFDDLARPTTLSGKLGRFFNQEFSIDKLAAHRKSNVVYNMKLSSTSLADLKQDYELIRPYVLD